MLMKFWLCAPIALLISCDFTTGEGREAVEKTAMAWAEAYFNYDFSGAEKYVTPESQKWLSFAASNVSQDDIDELRQKKEGATISVDDYEECNDSTAVVTMEVNGFLLRDTIGRPGHIANGLRYQIVVVRRDGRQMVRMEGLPRSERHSRD